MESLTTRDQLIEIVNKLFIYTNQKEWDKLQSEVFAPTVHFDMSSHGGVVTTKTSKEICDDLNTGFGGLDSVNHLAGNHLVSVEGSNAEVFCYATATHYRESATQGKTRDFVGTYELKLSKKTNGWLIHSFKYNLKYMNGNLELK